MKQILMLQGVGNNEQAWARLMSRHARVVLVQRPQVVSVEVWEHGKRTHVGEKIRMVRSTSTVTYALFLGFLVDLQVLRLALKHCRGSKIDLTFASSYDNGFIAVVLKWFGKSLATVNLATDYLPLIGPWHVRLHRRMTEHFARRVAKWSDEAWRVSSRISTSEVNPNHHVVPLYIDANDAPLGERRDIAYVGNPTEDHALTALFEICRKHAIALHVIGHSPYLERIRKDAPPDTTFYGYLNDRSRFNQILSTCFCGYAVYLATGPESYSYYGIPSKAFRYLADNVPVITTQTGEFTTVIAEQGIGLVVEPDPDAIERGILRLRSEIEDYFTRILKFKSEWNRDVETFIEARLSLLIPELESGGGNCPH